MVDLGAVKHSLADRLSRYPFAAAIAKLVFHFPKSDEGYVVGIEGPWGSGKSSVVNMVIEELRHMEVAALSSEGRYIGDTGTRLEVEELKELAVLEAKVPDYALTIDRDYYTADVVKRHLCREGADSQEEAEKIYRYFRLRHLAEQQPHNIVFSFQPWLIPESAELATVFIRELTLAIGQRFGREVAESADEYRMAVAELAPIAGAAADMIAPGLGRLFSGLAGLVKAHTPSRTLEERKQRLEDALRSQSYGKIIVVIDDLDRLLPREAVEMISLLKGLGRLPGVVYLISYDQENLSALVNAATGLNGHEFLEKIVQYKRPLPLLAENALATLVDAYIDRSNPPISGPALERVQSAWRSAIQRTLRTPRDAIRIGNSFLTGWNLVGQYMDAGDFLLLQFLLHTDPELYSFIEINLRVLCGLDTSLSNSSVKDLLATMTIEPGSIRGRVLALLFPKAAEALVTYSSSGLQTARIDRRLHTFDYRAAYFDLAMPTNVLSKVEIADLISSSEPEAKLRSIIEQSEKDAQGSTIRIELLDDLRQYYGDGTAIPEKMALAIARTSPLFIRLKDETDSFYREDNEGRLSSILFRGLDATPVAERGPLLGKLVHSASDPSLVAAVTRTALGPREESRRDQRGLDVNGMDDAIRESLLDRIRELARKGLFFEQASPRNLAWFWWDSGDRSELRGFLDRSATRAKLFPLVVELTIGVVVSSDRGRYETVPRYLDDLLTLTTVDKQAAKFAKSSKVTLVEAALRYQKARREDGR